MEEPRHPPTIDQLAAELDHLARDIDRARWDLARCHHLGEPHFCDHATPRFRLALEANLERLQLMEDRWRRSQDQTATETGLQRTGTRREDSSNSGTTLIAFDEARRRRPAKLTAISAINPSSR